MLIMKWRMMILDKKVYVRFKESDVEIEKVESERVSEEDATLGCLVSFSGIAEASNPVITIDYNDLGSLDFENRIVPVITKISSEDTEITAELMLNDVVVRSYIVETGIFNITISEGTILEYAKFTMKV